MFRFASVLLFAVCLLAPFSLPAQAAQHETGTLETSLVPGAPGWFAILPDGHNANSKPLPIIFVLHGGGGDKNTWPLISPLIEKAWEQGTLPPCVVVMVQAGRSFYMDFKDGSEKWETFYLTEFIPTMRQRLNAASGQKNTAIMGMSMGGMGSLRMAFKHPEKFAAVAALEPALESRTDWDDLTARDTFYRDGQYERFFGDPVDKIYWQRNHPTFIADMNARAIRKSDIQIYVEVGDEDMLYLYHGAEKLHRTLWDRKVKHEYRLVRGADHVGPSLLPRFLDALGFVGRAFNPPDWTNAQVIGARGLAKAMALKQGKWSLEEDDSGKSEHRD